MSLQIHRGGVSLPDDEQAAVWRHEFDEVHSIHVRGLLAPDLLAWIRGRLATAAFREQVHKKAHATNKLLDDPPLYFAIASMLNDARLFGFVQALSGCDPIGCYVPIVYKLEPSRHYDAWHDDADGNRMIAMSINVGGEFDGGVLKIRETGSRRMLREIANTGDGDATIFRIREDLEHFVTPVTGSRPRLAAAGWFVRTPLALSRLKRALGHDPERPA
jgi:hypothetical protein